MGSRILLGYELTTFQTKPIWSLVHFVCVTKPKLEVYLFMKRKKKGDSKSIFKSLDDAQPSTKVVLGPFQTGAGKPCHGK